VKETAKLIAAIRYPLIFIAVLWGIKIVENAAGIRLTVLGIYPLHVKGIPGILFAPLIHNDHVHLFTNTGPLLILGTALFYFYRVIALRLTALAWLMTGLWVWFGGREAWHIGSSGLIYSMASFLFISGFIRKSIELMALSFIVVFLYGGMLWGVFPLREGVSWESHLMGAIAGIVLAVYYRDEGPQRKKYSWELEEEEEVLEEAKKEELDESRQKDQESPGNYSQ